MGCISSKHMARSMSLKEELKNQKSAGSINPALEESSINPQNINDQSLALVYKALENSDRTSKEELPFRSFHTVEEYDAMTEKILLSDAEPKQSVYDASLTELHIVQYSQLRDETCLDDNCSTVESFSISSQSTKQILEEPKIVDNPHEKGFKRKSITKGLCSLEIPSTVDFSAVASLNEWLHSQSPTVSGDSLPSEDPIFNHEWLAAFEESLQQLEAEAENILKQISQNLGEEECPVDG